MIDSPDLMTSFKLNQNAYVQMAPRLKRCGKGIINLEEEKMKEGEIIRLKLYEISLSLVGIFCVYLNPVNEFRNSSIDSR